MKRVAESSTGSHRAGNGPQRVRINTQHSNDGDGKLGLLFAEQQQQHSSHYYLRYVFLNLIFATCPTVVLGNIGFTLCVHIW